MSMRVRAAGTPSTQNLRLIYHYLRALLSLLSRTPIRRRERAMRSEDLMSTACARASSSC